MDSLLLADDPLVELSFEPEESLALFFGELGDRNAGGLGDYLGYVFSRDLGGWTPPLAGLLKLAPKFFDSAL